MLLAAVAATLAVLGVRDWRCYGAAYLSIPVLHDVRLGALTPLLALGLALVWRWRSEARASVPLALIVVAKLFLWPLTLWLVATGRVRVALRGAVLAVVACALGWAVIGFAGLGDYPKLLSVLAEAEQGRGYSLVSAGLWLGLGPGAARAVAVAIGVVLLAACWREGRRGLDERSLVLALAAALALSPIVWLHYFVLLLVPIAIARRTFGAIWLIPALFWITPYEEHFAQHWRIAVGIAVCGAGVARGGAGDPRSCVRFRAMTRSWNPASPAGGGLDIPYSPAAVSDGYVHVAGVISTDESGAIVTDDFASQARRTFANLVTTLEAAGCSAADVVHVTTYLTDRGDFEAFNAAFVETFSEPYPARVTVLAQLIVPGLSIEVTAVAARPR